MKDVLENLRAKKVTFNVNYGSSPNIICGVSINVRDKTTDSRKKIRIKGITPEHALLDRFCKAFSESQGLKLDYKGEGMPSLMNRALNELVVCLLYTSPSPRD